MNRVFKPRFLTTFPCTVMMAACLIGTPARGQEAPGSESQQSAGAQDEARRRFARGLELYKESDYTAALIEFRRAYSLIPSYKLLFNIGQVCYQLQNYACGLQAFEQYLAEGGPEVVGARRTSVEADIEKLRTRVGKIQIRTNQPGATISVDDVVVGKTPLEPIMVSAGMRRVSASFEGKPTIVRSISVAGEENASIDFDVSDAGRGKAEASAAGAASASRSGPMPSWPFWVATGGLAVGAGVAGFLATRANSDLQQQRQTFGIDPNTLRSTERRASTNALVADILAGTAIVAGGIALYTTLSGRKKTETAPPAAPQRSSVELGVGIAAISVHGTF